MSDTPEYTGDPADEAIQNQFTWENGPGQAFDPSRWNDSVAPGMQHEPPGMPGQDTGAPTGSTPSSDRLGGSVAYKGMTSGGLKRSGDLFQQAEDNAAQYMAPRDAESAKNAQRFGIAYNEERDALHQQAAAEKQYHANISNIYRREMDFNQHAADTEMKAAADAKAEREQYLGAFKEQLAGVRTLMQQSGNPLGTLGLGGAAAMGAAQFAQGFLAARGIHIDVAGQIDHWVERSMQEHQNKITNARGAAQDTLSLYNIARQSSSDDFEARQRMRGFVIEGFKGAIQMEASRFQSSIADSRAQEAMAKLDVEQTNTFERLGDKKFHEGLQARQSFIDEAFKKGTLAIENLKAQAELARANAAGQKQTAGLKLVSDPGDTQIDPKTGKPTSGGKFKWVVDTKNAEAFKETNKAREFYANMKTDLDDLRDLKKRVDVRFGPGWIKDRESEGYRLFNNQRNLIVGNVQHMMTGAQATDAEAQRYLAQLPDDHWLQAGENNSAIDNLQRWGRKHFEHSMDTWAERADRYGALPKGQEYDQLVTADPSQKAAEDARFSGHDAGISPVNQAVTEVGARTSYGMQATHERTEHGISPSFSDFLKESKLEAPKNQTSSTNAVDHLALLVVHPEKGVQIIGAKFDEGMDASTTAQSALKSLKMLASGEDLPGGTKPNHLTQSYAKFVLSKIGEDPWASGSNNDALVDYYGKRLVDTESQPQGGPTFRYPEIGEAIGRGRNQVIYKE